MSKQTVILSTNVARKTAIDAILAAPDGWVVQIGEPTRSVEQNAVQWPILTQFSQQRPWPVSGELEWLKPEEWKDILTADFDKERIRLASGISGGVVMIGKRTREFGRREFSDWIDYLYAAAHHLGVYVEKLAPKHLWGNDE